MVCFRISKSSGRRDSETVEEVVVRLNCSSLRVDDDTEESGVDGDNDDVNDDGNGDTERRGMDRRMDSARLVRFPCSV